MVCFGFYAHEHRGGTYRRVTANGVLVYQRFRRWRDKGIWEHLLEILVDEPDFEWLMIDASHCKVHPHAVRAKGGNQDMSRTKRRLNTKIHLAVGANGMPVRVLITEETRSDCKESIHLIEGISVEILLADRGYDTDHFITLCCCCWDESCHSSKTKS